MRRLGRIIQRPAEGDEGVEVSICTYIGAGDLQQRFHPQDVA